MQHVCGCQEQGCQQWVDKGEWGNGRQGQLYPTLIGGCVREERHPWWEAGQHYLQFLLSWEFSFIHIHPGGEYLHGLLELT